MNIWVRLPRSACVIAFGVLLSLGQTAFADAPAKPAIGVPRELTLAQLGYQDGIALQGVKGEFDVYFDVPLREYARFARIRIDLQFTPTLNPGSGVTFLINGEPQATIDRRSANAQGWAGIDLPIPATSLKSDYLKLTLRYSLVNDRDICVDQRLGEGFIRVAAASGLRYWVPREVARTPSGVWDLLPRQVTLGVPRRSLTSGEFAAAYALAAGLMHRGRTVSIEPLASTADIAVGGPKEMPATRSFVAFSPAPPTPGLSVFQDANHATLGVIADHKATALELLSRKWETPDDRPVLIRTEAKQIKTRDGAITFAQMGFNDLTKSFAQSAEWNLALNLRQMPHARMPTRLRLNVVSAQLPQTGTAVLHTYLNGSLVQSDRLAMSGKPQTVVIGLPAYLVQTYNNVRIVAQRDQQTDPCRSGLNAYPLQILSSSAIETSKVRRYSGGFRDLALFMDEDLTVYIHRSIANDPVRLLRYTLFLSRSFWDDDLIPEVRVFDDATKLEPKGAFVVFSRNAPKDLKAPLRIEGEEIQLQSQSPDPVLTNFTHLDRWTVMQTAELNDKHGLWVAPAAQEPRLAGATHALGNEDVSLVDAEGRTFRFNSDERDVFDLSTTQRAGFQAALLPYRWPLFVLGWLVVTSLIVYLAVLARRHRQ